MLRPERWHAGLAGVLLMAAGGVAFLLQSEAASPNAAWKQQQILRIARWQSVMPLQAALNVAADATLAATKPFSPVDFQRPGAELMSWTPAVRGGELVLETEWEQVPSVFMLLAERGMRVSAFSLQAGETRHVLTLQLESINAE
ncbi:MULTISPECIES: HofO family protein [unclassified Pseudocitrobacter]|uniref:HofO family protein n=1 Tax=unclassified Pseudocitrobacter TaxID=2638778 RepID=UPI0023E3EAEB|nr:MULTISPECIES: hypothetical protein [unclassified Pseudocitrobacter]MDF3826591.1 hypothetical protein [Pseudocitrobacter sp. 2023EL-00150]